MSIASTPKYDIVTTKYYDVHRAGSLRFSEMMRQALTKNDRKLSDGIYPYQFKDTKPFSTALLSGYMAEKRDIGKDSAEQEMVQEARGQVEKLMTSELHYDTLHGKASFTPTKAKMRYFLLPTWVITYRGDKPGTTFYYMMNAQTGHRLRQVAHSPGKAHWRCRSGRCDREQLALCGRCAAMVKRF